MVDDALPTIVTALAIVIALLIGIGVVDEFAQSDPASGTDTQITRQSATLWDSSGFVTLNNGRGDNEEIFRTTGFAVNLSGYEDSYVQSESNFELASDDTWTVSVWGYVDAGNVAENMTLTSANGRAIISYNGSNNEWQGWYYDEAQRNSYTVTVGASGSEVGNFTNIQFWSNGTHLTIYRNTTQGEIKNITTQNIESAPVDAGTWDGRIEELRTFDDALDATNRSQLFNNGVQETPDLSPTSRAMFDQPNKNTQLLLYTDTRLEQSNVSFSSGFAKETSSNYTWDSVGPEVQATNDLNDAPVLYASYDFSKPGLANVVVSWSTFVTIASLLPVILLGIVIVLFVQRRT